VTTLDRRQRLALEALMVSTSVVAASKGCGVSTRSIFRYLQDPKFKAACRARRNAALTQAQTLLLNYAGGAVGKLLKLADSEDPAVSGPALRCVLTFAFGAAASADVHDRLADLEQRLASRDVSPLRAVPRRTA
jgi:hypothetical protein